MTAAKKTVSMCCVGYGERNYTYTPGEQAVVECKIVRPEQVRTPAPKDAGF